MPTEAIYSILAVVIVSLISFIGILTVISHINPRSRFINYLVSFAAGALLGDVFIHLLPELAEEGVFDLRISLYILGAIVLLFVIEKYVHWHHHASEHDEAHHQTKPYVYTSLIGDGLHNLIDGVVITGAFLLDVRVGIATTIAVILHEIPQEFADFGILVHGGLSKLKALMYNFFSALTALAGAVIVLLADPGEDVVNVLVALGAGSFIYLATADLIPEIHKEKKQSLLQLFSFGLGIAVMFALLYLE